MKKAFLLSTSPVALLQKDLLLQKKMKEADEAKAKLEKESRDENPGNQKPDRSVLLMAQIIGMAMIRLQGIDQNDFYYGAAKIDGHNGFTFLCRDDADEVERAKIMEAVAESFRDLDDANISPYVAVSPEQATIIFSKKMALYELIENYIDDNEDALLTVDNFHDTAFVENGDLSVYSKEARELLENPGAQDFLLGSIEPRPYLNREHYEASLMAGYYAHIKLSMQHVLQTIGQEDNLPRDRKRYNHLVLGGYQ